MKAIQRSAPGKGFSTMQVANIQEPPPPAAGEIQVRMAASRINPVDMDLMKGVPFVKNGKAMIGGVDGAGTVLAVGIGVTDFQPGDAAFFYRKFSDLGTWAEVVNLPSAHAARVPAHMSLLDAGGITLPLLTAHESLHRMSVRWGETILVHGAAGGVGWMAVQLALAAGLKVVATAAKEDHAALQALGVGQCIDYRQEAFDSVLAPKAVDLVLDTVGGETLLRSIALRPRVVVSLHVVDPAMIPKVGGHLPGWLAFILKLMMGKYHRAARRHGVSLLGQVTGADGALLDLAARLAEACNLKVRLPRTLSLAEIKERGLDASSVGKVISFEP